MKLAKKKPSARNLPPPAGAGRVLVQALLDPDLKAWVDQMARDRSLPVGAYLRALLRYCRELDLGGLGYQQVVVVRPDKRGKPLLPDRKVAARGR